MAHQLKIVLKYTEPLIHRTVIVPEVFTFEALHDVIQLVMNWNNSHLYQFNLGAAYGSDTIQIFHEDEDDFDFGPRFEKYDATKTYLSDFFNGQKKMINYIYDFGDDWIHEIRVQKKPKEEVLIPICIKGENAAPVDDCGSIHGFYNMIDILNEKGKSSEKKELLEWLGITGRKSYEDEFEFNLEEKNHNIIEFFKKS